MVPPSLFNWGNQLYKVQYHLLTSFLLNFSGDMESGLDIILEISVKLQK